MALNKEKHCKLGFQENSVFFKVVLLVAPCRKHTVVIRKHEIIVKVILTGETQPLLSGALSTRFCNN